MLGEAFGSPFSIRTHTSPKEDQMKQFPFVSDELLTALEEAFPDKAPRSTNTTMMEVGAAIGQQNVLDLLRRQHKKQTILEG